MKNLKESNIEFEDDVVDVVISGKSGESNNRLNSFSALVEKFLPDDYSNQIDLEVSFFSKNSGDVIEPPYDPLTLVCMLELNTRLSQSISIKARQSVGLGYDVRIKSNAILREPDLDKRNELRKQAFEQKYKLLERLESICDLPLSELFVRIVEDKLTTGNGYMVVSRNIFGDIVFLDHVPSHTIRLLRNGLYIQRRDAQVKYFKKFGDPRIISASTGEVGNDSLPVSDRAHEILHFKVYSGKSSYYGIPKWISSVPAVLMKRFNSEKLLELSHESIEDKYLLMIQQGKLDDDTKKRLKEVFTSDLKNRHKDNRLAVIQSVSRGALDAGKARFDFQEIPISNVLSKISNILELCKRNDQEVRESLGIAEIFFNTEGVNRASAREAKQTSIENEFIPELNSFEKIFNSKIVKSMKFDLVELTLVRPKADNNDEQSQIESRYVSNGIKSVNEAREAIGLEPFIDDLLFARLPWPVAEKFIEFGMIAQPFISKETFSEKRDKQQSQSVVDNVSNEIQIDEMLLDSLKKRLMRDIISELRKLLLQDRNKLDGLLNLLSQRGEEVQL